MRHGTNERGLQNLCGDFKAGACVRNGVHGADCDCLLCGGGTKSFGDAAIRDRRCCKRQYHQECQECHCAEHGRASRHRGGGGHRRAGGRCGGRLAGRVPRDARRDCGSARVHGTNGVFRLGGGIGVPAGYRGNCPRRRPFCDRARRAGAYEYRSGGDRCGRFVLQGSGRGHGQGRRCARLYAFECCGYLRVRGHVRVR